MTQLNTLIERLRLASTPSDAAAAIQALAATQNSGAILPLIEALSHHHVAVAAVAANALVQLAPDAVEPLIAAFSTTADHGVQAYIVQVLAKIGDPRAVEVLLAVVGTAVANHCQGNVRRVAARGLARLCRNANDSQIVSRSVEKLSWALFNVDDWALRYAAAVSLKEIGTLDAIAALQQALTQERDNVVQARIQAAL